MFPIKQLYPSLILVEYDDEEDEYISEDREMETKRNCKTAQRVQMAILQDLRQTLGVAATLPEEAAKDLVLQVYLILLSAVLTIKPSNLKPLSHIPGNYPFPLFFLYRESVTYKWVAGCRRWPQNINTRDSPEYM